MNNTKYISKNPSPSYLCSDLVAALAGLDVDDLPHGCDWSSGSPPSEWLRLLCCQPA